MMEACAIETGEERLTNFVLPKSCIENLDADGVVRGKTWRDMPARGGNTTERVLNWWLWKRGLLGPSSEFDINPITT